MSETIQSTVTAIVERSTDHLHATSTLSQFIEAAYPGTLGDEDRKKLEAFVGQVVSDVESRSIDPYTGAVTLEEAFQLAAAGVPDFLDLIAIGEE